MNPVAGKLSVLLVLLWLLPAQGWDSCLNMDWLCGDTCIPYGTKCQCGVDQFHANAGQWCCYTAPCTANKGENVTCTGTTLPLTTPCRGSCNHYPQDELRDQGGIRRSHIMCSEGGQCVQEWDICRGDAICDDMSDLAWCQHQQRQQEPCPRYYIRCNTTLGLPGQCVPEAKKNDGRYQCLDRSEEDPYSMKTDVDIDLSQLQPCTNAYGEPGLTCSGALDGRCHELVSWCWGDGWFAVQCQELGGQTTSLPQLCGNTTFWAQYPCEGHVTTVQWSRCSGRNSGECVGSWDCEDRSNVFRPASEGTCNATTEFGCIKNNVSVCLEAVLRCDQHPQCDGGEDEHDCEATYRMRGYTAESALHLCESPYHNSGSQTPTVTIWATRCDGRKECYRGTDEEYCNPQWVVYTTMGRAGGVLQCTLTFNVQVSCLPWLLLWHCGYSNIC